MFEFDQQQMSRSGKPSRPAMHYEPFTNISRRALLQWGEHCVECVAPDCYKSCDLYDARPDGRCRRFAYGMSENRHYPTAHGAAAEVVFRRWAKLEARANACLFSISSAGAIERGLRFVAPVLNQLGRLGRALTRDVRWGYLNFALRERLNAWLHRLASGKARPDAFIIEVYNPDIEIVEMTLSMGVDRTKIRSQLRADQLPTPYLRNLSFAPGYNRVEIPVDEFATIIDSGLPFSLALLPKSIEGTHLVFLSLDLVTYAHAEAAREKNEAPALVSPVDGEAAKCVVFDLDNTLWSGTLVEGKVTLREGVEDIFRTLDQRGILISVVSKNNHADAWAQLEKAGLAPYILHPQIGWGPKSAGIAALAGALDIGLSSLIMIDDSPFERAEVTRVHPQVETLPDTAISALLAHPRLQGAATPEAGRRRHMYRQAEQRKALAIEFDGDYHEFLRSCAIELYIFDVNDQVHNRAAELVQRTNQLNFSGQKYSRAAFAAILANPDIHKTALFCRDKFGDYGVIGICTWVQDAAHIHVHDLMISCRVQGKFIEQALFASLAKIGGGNVERITLNFRKTDRNGLAQAVLAQIGFDENASGQMEFRFASGDLDPDFITVKFEHPPA